MSRTNFSLGGLAEDCFFDSSPPFSVGSCLQLPKSPSFSVSALRAAAVASLRNPGYSFRFLPLVVLPETLSLLRFAWLADWVAVCQPGFYWRLEAYSYFRSCEGAYS